MSVLNNFFSERFPGGIWPSIVPYATPPLAAGFAIVPVFRDLIIKSAEQRGEKPPDMTFMEGIVKGVKGARTVGILVGTQMIIQNQVEKVLSKGSSEKSFKVALASSAIVAVVTSPMVAFFNGQTIVGGSVQKFSAKQGMAIVAQETAFVAGITLGDQLATVMKSQFGDHKVVDYTAAFISGSMGSLAGHPANTALTRWQVGFEVEVRQLMWGSARKAWAIGVFSMLYKFGKEF